MGSCSLPMRFSVRGLPRPSAICLQPRLEALTEARDDPLFLALAGLGVAVQAHFRSRFVDHPLDAHPRPASGDDGPRRIRSRLTTR